MELRLYVNFEEQEILTEKEFEERKKIVVQDLVDDGEFLNEFLENEFQCMADLFVDLESGFTTIGQIKENYQDWVQGEVERNNNELTTSLDEFEEYCLEV